MLLLGKSSAFKKMSFPRMIWILVGKKAHKLFFGSSCADLMQITQWHRIPILRLYDFFLEGDLVKCWYLFYGELLFGLFKQSQSINFFPRHNLPRVRF